MSAIYCSAREIFECVLSDLPEADECEYAVIHDICHITRRINRVVFYPGDLFPDSRNKKHIMVGYHDRAGWDERIWVNNSYLFPWKNTHHFGMSGRLTPPGEEAMRYRMDQGCWHLFDTEDELVEAVINCVNRRK